MWVTQTYLRDADPGALVYVYYLFEDYNNEQVETTNLINRELSRMGDTFKANVSLLMPNPNNADDISGEIFDKFKDFWPAFAGKLPGILLCTEPMAQVDLKKGDYRFFSFRNIQPAQSAGIISDIWRALRDSAAHQHVARGKSSERRSSKSSMLDFIEIKPGIGPLKFDVKAAFLRYRR